MENCKIINQILIVLFRYCACFGNVWHILHLLLKYWRVFIVGGIFDHLMIHNHRQDSGSCRTRVSSHPRARFNLIFEGGQIDTGWRGESMQRWVLVTLQCIGGGESAEAVEETEAVGGEGFYAGAVLCWGGVRLGGVLQTTQTHL